MPALRIRITGRVQGVFFRTESKKMAESLRLTGWVRNLDDGSVDIHAEGDAENLETFIAWCCRGPPAAEVDGVDSTSAEEAGYRTFDVKR